MSNKSIPEDEVKKLAKEIASKALDEVLRKPGGFEPPGLGYECNQVKFECSVQYDCVAPDSCALEVSCPKRHSSPT